MRNKARLLSDLDAIAVYAQRIETVLAAEKPDMQQVALNALWIRQAVRAAARNVNNLD